MKKVIYIVGMGYSGTTILDLLLGCHPQMVGLGEIQLVVGQKYDRLFCADLPVCACGERMDECSFWGNLVEPLRAMKTDAEAARYKKIVDHFYLDSDSLLVDSSKHIGGLDNLLKLDDVELKVLYIIKDVRSFAASNAKHFKRRFFDTNIELPLKKRLINEYAFPHWGFIRWHRANRRLKRYMDGRKIDYFQFGYEELCLHPEVILPKICDFIEVDYAPEIFDLGNSTSHTVLGNGLLLDKNKKSRLVYDNRWFCDQRLMCASFFCHTL